MSLFQFYSWLSINYIHHFVIWNEKPTDVTISILLMTLYQLHSSLCHMKWKTNRCHYFNFIHDSLSTTFITLSYEMKNQQMSLFQFYSCLSINYIHHFVIWNERPTDVTISILFMTLYQLHSSLCHMKWKANRCHYFSFIHISTGLYMFRAHRPIFRRVHTAVHTTIGSVSVMFWSRATRTVQILNQWLCEQLCELS